MWDGNMGWGGWLIGVPFMILFWGLLILGIVALVRYLGLSGPGAGQRHEDTPLDILKRRYVRGEIDKEEFEQKKRDLS
ncbi:MAG: SHOCT domain-containing protein [Chloroflexi bacterium]|nr:SHOCT domain-containing protein [Chloroflexota bacterium]